VLNIYSFNQYLLKRQIFALTGTFRIYGPDMNLLMYSRQKMFRLKEDIRVYNDESESQELLHIQARQLLDFSAAYDIYDMLESKKVGAVRRQGLRSLIRDEWLILDNNDVQIGTLIEDTQGRALLRRFLLGVFLPQNYDLLQNGIRTADFRQNFNLFRYELVIDLSENISHQLDPRLAIALGILLAAIEGRQSD
jgi:hypothetical protein